MRGFSDAKIGFGDKWGIVYCTLFDEGSLVFHGIGMMLDGFLHGYS